MSLQKWDQSDPFRFSGSVGRNGENDRADVIKAQMLLAEAGALDLPRPGLPTGWAGEGLTEAIRHIQKANDLPVDGVLLPLRDGAVGENGEGETLQALKTQVGDRIGGLPVPTPDQVDSFFDAYARDPKAEPIFQRPEKRDFGTGKEKGPQEAMLPLAWPLLAVGAPLALGAGEYLRRQYDKSRRETFTRPPDAPVLPPLRPATDTEKAQTAIPPLRPPEPEARLQGRPAADTPSNGERLIPPDIRKWVSGLPPEQQPLADELAGIIVEAHQFGPQGSPRTVEATKIITRVCFEQLQKRPDLAGKLFHVAGSYKEGKGDRLTEEWVPRQDTSGEHGAEKLKGGVHVDSSFGPDDPDDKDQKSPYWARMQTVDFSRRADEHDPEGRYKREKDADTRLLQNMKTGVAEWARKMRPGETAEDYAAYAKIRCDRMWDRLEARLRRDGHLPAR